MQDFRSIIKIKFDLFLSNTVGANSIDDEGTKQVVQDLLVALQRLPKVHLLVLDVFLRHLKT